MWDAVAASGKPVIVHNGFLDVLFTFAAMYGKSVLDVSDFKKFALAKVPGGFYDTKLL